jgi:Ni,Fe-hydrogenase I cytochrome b subunit
MNFKFNLWKTIISIIAGLITGAYLGYTYRCIGNCFGNLILQKLFFFVLGFLIISILIYVLWSLIQKKK